MIIAIAGPAASGKGTIARMLARELHLPHYDFGLIFRSIALVGIESSAELSYQSGEVILRGENITHNLRSEEVGLLAARMAGCCLDAMIEAAQKMVYHPGFVCDGRTVGVDVYSCADYKFFLDAERSTRMARRKKDGGNAIVFQERELTDRNRFMVADDAVLINTTGKTVEQSLQEILSCIYRQ